MIIRSSNFICALKIISYSEEIRQINRFEMASQIFRSGTSIGANIREAQNAESKADFIHKFKISAKEIEETIYWLELCKFSENYPNVDELLEQINNKNYLNVYNDKPFSDIFINYIKKKKKNI
mgnify:CR=1 FL=1